MFARVRRNTIIRDIEKAIDKYQWITGDYPRYITMTHEAFEWLLIRENYNRHHTIEFEMERMIKITYRGLKVKFAKDSNSGLISITMDEAEGELLRCEKMYNIEWF